MAGRTPAEALAEFLEPLRKVVSCVSPAVLWHNCHDPRDGEEHFVTLPNGDPIRVSCARGGHYRLRLEQRFRVVSDNDRDRGPWKVTTVKYEYALDDDDETEIIAFHWHPREQGFDSPHVHLSSGAGDLRLDLQRAYIPTARIALEDFVLFTIRDFGLQHARGDYKRVLEASKSRFEKWKRW